MASLNEAVCRLGTDNEAAAEVVENGLEDATKAALAFKLRRTARLANCDTSGNWVFVNSAVRRPLQFHGTEDPPQECAR